MNLSMIPSLMTMEASSGVLVMQSNRENRKMKSDGSTASYYQLPDGATELQHLISHRDMNSQIGEIFRSAYRYGVASHSDRLRDAKKIKFYIEAEIERLKALEPAPVEPLEIAMGDTVSCKGQYYQVIDYDLDTDRYMIRGGLGSKQWMSPEKLTKVVKCI